MNTPNEGSQIPSELFEKLRKVRARDGRVRRLTALLRAAAVLITAMLAAMLIDWVIVLFDHGWRWALTLSALGVAAAGMILWALKPLLHRRSLAAIARDVDAAHPTLQERCSTITEVSQSSDPAELRGSPALLKKVAEQAAHLSGTVTPDTVIPRARIIRAAQFLGVAAAALVVWFALDFSSAKVLAMRFWNPAADISLTSLSASPGDVVIGKGEPLTLEFAASGKPTTSATVFIRSESGRTERVSLKKLAAAGSGFSLNRGSVTGSFDYRARSGDGQTRWHRVTVADRPKLAQVDLRITPPAYSRLPLIEEHALPHRVRALEGSVVEAVLTFDQPLASMELQFNDGSVRRLEASDGNAYRFTTVLTNTIAFTPVFTSRFNLENQPRSQCEIVVYRDEAPRVRVVSPHNEITARPDDKITIAFEATDDFGIARAELIVTQKNGAESARTTIEIPLDDQAGEKRIRKEVELDLAPFNLKQDQEISYVLQVTDTKEHLASDSAEQAGAAQQMASAESNRAPSSDSRTESPQSPEQQSETPLRPDPTQHLAMRSQEGGTPNPAEGSQPPPNDMPRRVLDAGQASSCQPMKIVVDEWGRSFEGQMRAKLEIAIDPVLSKLNELLGNAQDTTDQTLATGKSPQGLSEALQAPVDSARGHLRESDSVVTDLKAKTQRTPYAFIGLQVHDIRESHISPARRDLGAVSLESDRSSEDLRKLEQASFEIKRARERLADLTKKYAEVKRDYKLADAMQRLQKMHQIFLEDTQAMLGSKKPVLNPQDRTVAEVDDEFVEKLRALLEEKKKLMAELAEILADDPAMLRRLLAIAGLDGTSFRDQMTLLAQRQQSLAADLNAWQGTEESARTTLLKRFMAAHSAEQAEIAAMAAALHENYITWLPRDVPRELDQAAECQALAADVGRLASEAAHRTQSSGDQTGTDSARQALERLRRLNARLPVLEAAWIRSERLSTFVANRQNEVADLITRQSGWLKKVEAIQAGDYLQAAEIDQHRLTLDSTVLAEKIEPAVAMYRGMSEEIRDKSAQLTATIRKDLLPAETGATSALSRRETPAAMEQQSKAVVAFADAEQQFDELLRLIIAKLDEAPAPTGVPPNPSLEDMLAMLEDEKKAVEGLGIPCRPINVAILRDWMQAGGQGMGQGSGRGIPQARAAQNQARDAAARADRAGREARERASAIADAETPGGPRVGPRRPGRSWNTLVSKLGEELRQGRDNVPPEQYRDAIETYFETISETVK